MKFYSGVLFLLLLIYIDVSAQKNLSSLEMIKSDFNKGLLNRDEALLQKLYSLNNSPELNNKYISKIPSKCGTEIIAEYYRNINTLDYNTKIKADALFSKQRAKQLAEFKYYSPSGKFELSYTTSGTNSVPITDSNNNNVPDFVEKIGSYFDYVWWFTIDSLGYEAPPITSGTFRIEFKNMEYYGYTEPVNWPSKDTKIVMHNNFTGFPSNNDPEGDILGAAKVTALHEFKHSLQFVSNSWNDGEGWLLELDATWMEDIGYDEVNDYYNYLSSSQIGTPGRSLDDSDGYEDCIFMHYLTQKFGNKFNLDFWNSRKNNTDQNVFNTINKTLIQYGSTLSESLPEYFVWNYLCGNNYLNGLTTYEEAKNYPTPATCGVLNQFPTSTSGCAIKYFGANNIVFSKFDFPGKFSFDISALNGPFSLAVISKMINASPEINYFNPSQTNKFFKLASQMNQLENLIIIPIVNSQLDLDYSYYLKFNPFQAALFTHSPVKDMEQATDLEINVKVETPLNIAKTDSLQLFWGTDGMDFKHLHMSPKNIENEFTATITIPQNEIRIFYYFSIYDSSGIYLFHPSQGSVSPFTFFVGTDTVPPVIELHNLSGELSKYNFPHQIVAKIYDNLFVDSAFVEFKINNGITNKTDLKVSKDSIYIAELNLNSNQLSVGDILNYRIKSVDGASKKNVKYSPETEYKSIKIVEGYKFSSTPNLFISDNNFPSEKDTITITEDFIISDIDVLIEVQHNRLSDFEMKLKTPHSSAKSIFERPGIGTENRIINPIILFDQSAAFSIESFGISGTGQSAMYYRPLNIDLDSYIGKNARGNWILNIYDKETGEQGYLKNWSLIMRHDNMTHAEYNTGILNNYRLENNYPNPFNPATKITYEIGARSEVDLSVFDILGNKLKTLVSGIQAAGVYTIQFNADNIASGVYLYTLKTGNFVATKKLLLLK